MPENISVNTLAQRGQSRQIRALVPIAIVTVIGVFFGIGLTLNPAELPSPLIGRLAPEFALPPVQGRLEGLSNEDLQGAVSLVNVFASWCTACRDEHPLFMQIHRQNIVPVYGLNYRDRPEDAATWLDTLGDPYARTGADVDGRVGIDWGVYGVPETYVVDSRGRIAYKHIGAIDSTVLTETLLPLVQNLRDQP
ncbi:MAG: DsbE family thiol:disulfide interchange protein [Burkholderiales bacterium]|nr:DsbE family thiol:disulfide interchange protein [Burkholderiales bacterium]